MHSSETVVNKHDKSKIKAMEVTTVKMKRELGIRQLKSNCEFGAEVAQSVVSDYGLEDFSSSLCV
jgi:hypothetical protein